jgi:hypothetical protein
MPYFYDIALNGEKMYSVRYDKLIMNDKSKGMGKGNDQGPSLLDIS